jgi:prophage tail gpP-like protein
MSNATLLVNGNLYSGWKTVNVSRSMRAVSGIFQLTLSARYPGQPAKLQIFRGDKCELFLAGKPVIKGFVDSRTASITKDTHTISVRGRDLTADMVDGAPEIGTYEFIGLNALEIGQRLAAPFKISVSSSVALLSVLDKFPIQPGETAFECLDRACRLSGVFATGTASGAIVLSREGKTRAFTELVEGQNVLTATDSADDSDRYRTYIVAGQHSGSDGFSGEDAAAIEGRATDKNARAGRILYIRASSNMTQPQAQERAEWEATNRAAAAGMVSVTVQGWQQGNGALWAENTKTRTRIPTLGIDSDMLITDITFNQDDQGTITELELSPPGSFTPAPEVPVPDADNFGVNFDD